MENHQLYQRLKESSEQERHWQPELEEWTIMQQRLKTIPPAPTPFYYSPNILLAMTTTLFFMMLGYWFLPFESLNTTTAEAAESTYLIENFSTEDLNNSALDFTNLKETNIGFNKLNPTIPDKESDSFVAEHANAYLENTIASTSTKKAIFLPKEDNSRSNAILALDQVNTRVSSTEGVEKFTTSNDFDEKGTSNYFKREQQEFSNIEALKNKTWNQQTLTHREVQDTFIIRVPPVKEKRSLPLRWQIATYGYLNGDFYPAPIRLGVTPPTTQLGLGLKLSMVWREKFRWSIYANSSRNTYFHNVFNVVEPIKREDFPYDNPETIASNLVSLQKFALNTLEVGTQVDYSPFDWRSLSPYFGAGIHGLKVFEPDNYVSVSSDTDGFVLNFSTTYSTTTQMAITGLLGTSIKVGKRLNVFTEGMIFLTTKDNLQWRGSRYHLGMNYLF